VSYYRILCPILLFHVVAVDVARAGLERKEFWLDQGPVYWSSESRVLLSFA
jgi:hypothetical protein